MDQSGEFTSIHIDMDVYKALETKRLSFSENHNDILRRSLKLDQAGNGSSVTPKQNISEKIYAKTQRVTGGYGYVLSGIEYQFTSLKAAYKDFILRLAKSDAIFLEKLAREDTPARKIVSKDKVKLYKKNPHLADSYAELLVGDWWFDTNLSQQQTVSRIQMMCKIADIKYGKDLILKFI